MNKDQTPLPCPFCGGLPEFENTDERARLRCCGCGTEGGLFFYSQEECESGIGDETEARAIAAWNRRSEVEAARAQTAAEPTNLHARILEALLDHGLQHTRDDDDAGLPLVDALTRRGDKDIRSGIEEIELLADAIFDAVEPLYASPSFPAPAPTVDAQWVETAIELAEDYGKCRWNSAASGAMFDKVSVRHADEEAAEALAALRAHLMTAAPAPGVEEGTGVSETSDAARQQGNGGANG